MTYVVQFSIPYHTGIPSDVITNTWHFDWTEAPLEPGPALANSLVEIIAFFYEKIFEGAPGKMAQFVAAGNSSAKVYNLDDPTPRVPLWEGGTNVTVSEDLVPTLIPPEAAVCVSYHGEYQSGIDKASQRGRIYLGGIGNACIVGGAGTDFPTVDAGFRGDIGVFIAGMQASAAGIGFQWVVYSRKLDQSFPVVGGWVDNAIDTQRRRGQAATQRTNWSI